MEAAEGRIAEAIAGATQGMVPETAAHEAVDNARQEWETEVEGRIKQEIMMALEARNEGIRNLINEFHMNATEALGNEEGVNIQSGDSSNYGEDAGGSVK